MLEYFRGAPMKIYLHKHLTHEYFHTQKFPDLRYYLIYMKVGGYCVHCFILNFINLKIKVHIITHLHNIYFS